MENLVCKILPKNIFKVVFKLLGIVLPKWATVGVMAKPSCMHAAAKMEEMRLSIGKHWQSLVLLTCLLLPYKPGIEFLTAAMIAAAAEPSAVGGSNATSQLQSQEELA